MMSKEASRRDFPAVRVTSPLAQQFLDEHRDFPVVITPDPDGGFTAECTFIPGCISEGDTREAALANIREAIELCLQDPDVRAEIDQDRTDAHDAEAAFAEWIADGCPEITSDDIRRELGLEDEGCRNLTPPQGFDPEEVM